METRKSLTLNGISGPNFLFIINAAFMVGVSIYLTSHFYETLYPTKLGGAGSICDISAFFNCDAATFSKVSNLAGIPISFFGILMGTLFLFTGLMPSESLEKTSSAFAKYNFIGCVLLFIFSLVSLGSLCPFCSLYYVLSGLAAFLLWRYGINTWVPEVKSTAIWGVILMVGSFFMYQTTAGKEDTKNKLNASIVEQFRKLAVIGDPDQESPYKIHMATPNFADSPIRITVFSDFECPFCKVVAEQIPELIRRYPDKISVQYMFFPLDSKCNSSVKSRMHANACDGAALASCDEKKFSEIHDEIFAAQDQLSNGALTKIAKKHGLESCMTSPDQMNKVISIINQSAKYNLKSTPTLIVNGKKIEGTIPNVQFFAIFDDILKGQ